MAPESQEEAPSSVRVPLPVRVGEEFRVRVATSTAVVRVTVTGLVMKTLSPRLGTRWGSNGSNFPGAAGGIGPGNREGPGQRQHGFVEVIVITIGLVVLMTSPAQARKLFGGVGVAVSVTASPLV